MGSISSRVKENPVPADRLRRLISLLGAFATIFCLAVAPLWAQDTAGNEQGLKPYGTFHGGDIDEVSLANGNLSLKIPLISYPQRGGKIQAGFSLQYHNPQFRVVDTQQSTSKPFYWEGLYDYFYQGSIHGTAIDVQPDFNTVADCAVYFTGNQNCEQYGAWDPDGVVHQMGEVTSTKWVSLDATGFVYNPSTGILIDREGIKYTSEAKIEDPNGNLVTTTGTGWIDTVGRSIPFPWPCGIYGNCTNPITNYPQACLNQPLPVYSAVSWTPPGVNNGTEAFTFCFAVATGGAIPPFCTDNPPPDNQCYSQGAGGIDLQTVVLPDNTAWQFQYSTGSDGTGALTQITYPTGATISYTWGWTSQCLPFSHWQDYGFGVVTRTVDAKDGTGPHTWTYGTGLPLGSQLASVTDPLGNTSAYAITSLPGQSNCSFYQTQEQDYQGSAVSGTLLKTITTDYGYNSNPYSGAVPFPTSINVVPTTITTQYPNGKTKKTVKVYDTGVPMTGYGAGANVIYGVLTAENEYDYPSGTSLIRSTATSYKFQSDPNYLANNLLTLPNSVTVTGSGPGSVTNYYYDQNPLKSSGITLPTLDLSPPDGSFRGNLTSISRWLNLGTNSTTSCPISVSNGVLVSYFVYNDTGTIDHKVDSCGSSKDDPNHMTTYSYSPTSTCPQDFLGAFSTVVTNALGQSTNYCYDLNTGLTTSVTDPNGQTTGYQYDVMYRPSQIMYPPQQVNGTLMNGLTMFTYPSNTEVQMSELIDNYGSNRVSYLVTDGLHRELRHLVTNGETIPYDEVDTCYDVAGNKSFMSYPYQSSGPASGQNCSPPGDSFLYDALHRVLTVTHSDQSTVITSYLGRATSVSDEGNGTQRVQRISQVDGLGRLNSVCEVSGDMALGIAGSKTAVLCGLDISGTGFLTTYGYDALDNLTSVSQAPLNARSYSYDSLSRLVQATNPESGTTCYGFVTGTTCGQNGYDANGNLVVKTDARNVTTISAYDYLNRITQKYYTDGTTPSYLYSYDVAPPGFSGLTNLVGRRVLAYNQYVGTPNKGLLELSSYDAMGRVLLQLQETPASTPNSYVVEYAYDLLGDRTALLTGSGEMLNYQYNQAGRVTAVATTANAFGPAGWLFGLAHYNSAGALLSATLGYGINESRVYDGRLRLCGITAGYLGSLYTLAIPSSVPNQCPQGTTNGYAPNGNILQANDSVNGNWTYAYDAFNRLASANATGQAYTYAYDRFGNRWQQNGLHSSLPPGFDANNRILQVNGFTYDAAGNMTNDGTTAYTFDAENRVTTAVNPTSGTSTYTYDADGQRVEKTTTAGGTVDFQYDNEGHEIAQLSSAGIWMRGEVYAGGRHLAIFDNSTTYIVHADWLGTERARSSSVSGPPYETCTSLPFGDWLTCTASDPSPMHFTGKEHDYETSLENFGARYDSSQYGRFLTPDPLMASAHVQNPQTWNRYSYTLNDPVNLIDPDGMAPLGCDIYIKCADETDVPRNQRWSQEQQQSQAQNSNAAGQVAKDTVVGAAKEAANTIIDLSNAVNSVVDSALGLTGSSFSFGRTTQFQASTPGERSAMIGTSAALLMVGGPELKSADAIKFGKALASESQVAETGTTIAGAGTNVGLRQAGRLASQYGGNAADWSKMTSSAYRAGDSTVISTHWYENVAIGVRAEFKSIIDKALW
jgi:RHS repeat-associated protein